MIQKISTYPLISYELFIKDWVYFIWMTKFSKSEHQIRVDEASCYARPFNASHYKQYIIQYT